MEVPVKIIESWKRVNKRIDEFCEHDFANSFRLLFITDVHIGAEMANHINQLYYLHELIKLNSVDFIVNGGDIGLDVGEDEKEAKRVVKVTKEATNFNVPYFLLKGNHDFHKSITDNELTTCLNEYFLKNIKHDIGEIKVNDYDAGGYGFYIDKKTDTKLIFINTSESYRNYDLSKTQLEYLITQLENTKEKNVVIFSHYCPNVCGGWARYPVTDTDTMATLKLVLKDFASKNNGTNCGLKWDFRNNKSNFLIHLSGDSHFTNLTREPGYLITCRQGYGGILPIDIQVGGHFDEFDVDELCNFDILAINKNNKAKLFRVGAGENDRDIDIN